MKTECWWTLGKTYSSQSEFDMDSWSCIQDFSFIWINTSKHQSRVASCLEVYQISIISVHLYILPKNHIRDISNRKFTSENLHGIKYQYTSTYWSNHISSHVPSFGLKNRIYLIRYMYFYVYLRIITHNVTSPCSLYDAGSLAVSEPGAWSGDAGDGFYCRRGRGLRGGGGL